MSHGRPGTTGFLEGLVGGALTGADFRQRRTAQGVAAQERQRRITREDEAARIAAEDRTRAQTIQGLELRERFGLAFEDPAARVGALRAGVGQELLPGGPGEFAEPGQAPGLPPGMIRVGPSSAERADIETAEANRRIGLMLGGDQALATEDVGALREAGLLDEFARERFATPEADLPFGVNVGGITRRVGTAEEALALRGRLTPEATVDVPGVESSLRAEFQRNPVVRDSFMISQSNERLRAIAAQEPSGAGDLGLIFSFMKMLDPGSVVREGEFANAENAQGVPDRIRTLYNRALNGERLAPETRREFVSTANDVIAGQRRALGPVLERFRGLATGSGVDPVNVIFDPFPAAETGDELSDEEIDQMIQAGATDEEIAAEQARRRGG